MHRVALTGGYLSQNMGSAAMSLVSFGRLRSKGYEPILFSKYPNDDQALALAHGIPLRRANQLLFTGAVIPALLVAQLMPPVRRWIRRKWFAGIEYFYDIGGITFSPSRGPAGFAINLTWLLLPLLLRIPVVKGAQAMGPFNRWYLRASLPLLRKAKMIYARGNMTYLALNEAGLPVRRAQDIAFLLAPEPAPVMDGGYLTVIPSSVVMNRLDALQGAGTYLRILEDLLRWLVDSGERVCLLAHSYRPGSTLNSNDYPLCVDLAERLTSPSVQLYDVWKKTPGQLKYVISKGRLTFTSRFHGMIASLGSAVPVVATSWSHKYREVLDEFSLGEYAIDWRTLNVKTLRRLISDCLRKETLIRQGIESRLPMVLAGAEINFDDLPHVYEARL